MRSLALLALIPLIPLLIAAPASPNIFPRSVVGNTEQSAPRESILAGRRLVRRKAKSKAKRECKGGGIVTASQGPVASETPTESPPSAVSATPSTSSSPSVSSEPVPSSEPTTQSPSPEPTSQSPSPTVTPSPTVSVAPTSTPSSVFNDEEYECLEYCPDDDPDCVSEEVFDPTVSATSTSASTEPTGSFTSGDPTGTNGPFSGQATWYGVGLSACGTYDTSTMPIVAVSSRLFDSWPGYNGWNPNTNPICNKHIKATYGNTSVIVQVTDRCEGCAERDLDLSPSAFMQLAPLSYGRLEEAQRWIGNGMIDLHGITWEWVAGTGRLTELPCNDNAC